MKNSKKRPKILISTGIYPPDIGGPAEYAKNLEEEFLRSGHGVVLKTYGKIERFLPMGIRHLYYFFKIIPAVLMSDFIIALDTLSVGVPTVIASKIFFKKVVIRTGGDFLWESYVERTGDLVLLAEFYDTRKNRFNLKEKIIFYTTRLILKTVDVLIFSTKWQQNIWYKAYNLSFAKQKVIENHYNQKQETGKYTNKNFICATRPLRWKNIGALKVAFYLAKKENTELVLDDAPSPHSLFLERVKNAYAVILVSLGDISPNIILEAISYGVPFILTKENGLMDRIGDIGVFVNPKDIDDIKNKIIWLSNETNRKEMESKILNFRFFHNYAQISKEFLGVYRKI